MSRTILVALEIAGVALRCSLALGVVLVAGHVNVSRFVVPGRNLVAPPELPGDAPVLDVLQPMVVGRSPVLGKNLHVAGGNRLDPAARQSVHLDEPLVGEHRLRR